MRNTTCFLVLLLVACSSPVKKPQPSVERIIDIKTIAYKTPAEVEKVLGKPESTEAVNGYPCEGVKGCKEMKYKSGKYEIIFIKGKSTWITINNIKDLTGADNAIEAIGLKNIAPPSFKNPGVTIRWIMLYGFEEINFFPDYALIKVFSE